MTYGARSIGDVVKNVEYSESWGRRLPVIDYVSLEKWLLYKNLNQEKLLIRIEKDTAGVFSNDLECLKSIELTGIIPLDYTQACANIPNGAMYFKNDPKYKYRSYMRSRRMDKSAKQEVKEFINRYKLIPCTALHDWLYEINPRFFTSYISHSYFVSYDDDKIPLLMSIILPGIFNKHYKLEKRPIE